MSNQFKEELIAKLEHSCVPVRHLKTGNIYYVTAEVLNCTNANDGQKMFMYTNSFPLVGKVFVREQDEFANKFELVEE